MNICVFASGGGSNFRAILESGRNGFLYSRIRLLITNNSECGAVEIAKEYGVDVFHISRKVYPGLNDAEYGRVFVDKLNEYKIDLIVLAGYMKKIEPAVIKSFTNRIINIHPALLPSFGGKGMYGINVHKAVIDARVRVSGLTIHMVNEEYDSGRILFQKSVEVNETDNEYTLQKKILALEHKYYSYVIKKIEEGEIGI
ncbi:MAG: phosphoribosylglycinamide formyltransferase [Ignavibacteria bacterium]|nr:phosphoribosylglycinamide formyltransferase [Ignavibacteria bacterium]